MATIDKAFRKSLIVLIKLYRFLISPFLGQHCRFHPSCSQYAMTAIETHGGVKGTILAAKRFAKCHPFHPGGVDQVPGSCDHSPTSIQPNNIK